MTEFDAAGFTQLPDPVRAAIWDGLTMAERRAVKAAMLGAVAPFDPLADLDWREWNQTVAPTYFTADYAPHHVRFWEWTDSIGPDRPDPFLELWPRGHTKSTCAELAVIKLGARRLRTYFLYVSHTQDQADDHVGTIGSIIESSRFAEYYPAMSEVKTGKFGSSKGWRRNRLRTASGFTVDALGLDVARRGAKLEETRPDGMVLDDIDDTHASSRVVERNIQTITQALIPALQPNKVIILAQNLVAPGSIAARLEDGRADMLGGAIKSGPFPAIEDAVIERVDGRWKITAGVPTWPAGMDLDQATAQLVDMGLDAFTIEVQQDTSERPGAIWKKSEIKYWPGGELPEFDRVVVTIDPNKTGRGDDAGVVVIGRFGLPDGRYGAVVLDDVSNLTAPSEWRDDGARAFIKWGAGAFVVEFAGLGEHAELTVKSSPLLEGRSVAVYEAKAKLGKKDRARAVWPYYTDGLVWHARPLPYLERQMTGWEPDQDPVSPGALDALAHGLTHLLIDHAGPPNVAVAA